MGLTIFVSETNDLQVWGSRYTEEQVSILAANFLAVLGSCARRHWRDAVIVSQFIDVRSPLPGSGQQSTKNSIDAYSEEGRRNDIIHELTAQREALLAHADELLAGRGS